MICFATSIGNDVIDQDWLSREVIFGYFSPGNYINLAMAQYTHGIYSQTIHSGVIYIYPQQHDKGKSLYKE